MDDVLLPLALALASTGLLCGGVSALLAFARIWRLRTRIRLASPHFAWRGEPAAVRRKA